MYVTGPPTSGAGSAGRADPVRLRRAAGRIFAGSSELALDPQLRIFLADLVRPYGLPLAEDLLAAGSGHSYGEMAEALLPAVVSADEPVDLLVLAFAIHDIRLGRATAVYLSHVCPGQPLAFAVCDQGAAAAFTGLRLVGEYTRTGGCRRALLLVVEQATLHYRPAVAQVRIPDRHTAVALLFDGAGPAELVAVRQHPDVSAERVADLLATEVSALAGDRPEVTVLLGGALAAGLSDPTLGGRARVAGAGQPYTGVWWELADGLPAWAADGRRVLLADYDPALRYLCLSAVDIPAGAVTGPVGAGVAAGRPAQ